MENQKCSVCKKMLRYKSKKSGMCSACGMRALSKNRRKKLNKLNSQSKPKTKRGKTSSVKIKRTQSD